MKEKILVVEDELTNSILIKRVLTKEGFSVVTANNGLEAIQILENETFDLVLTDWMMPKLDGIELIRRIRAEISPVPLIIIITALVSEGAKTYALESGADDFIAKPIDVDELIGIVQDGLNKKKDSLNSFKPLTKNITSKIPPCVGVFIATSTGGPLTLIEVLKNIPENINAAFFVVQHGPDWMLETFTKRLANETNLQTNLGAENMTIQKGNLYLAPGDYHMRINQKKYTITIDQELKENFVRPAADPLFRSGVAMYGKYSIGVVLTGLGRDGTSGSEQLYNAGAKILIQSPETAIAPSMPNSALKGKLEARVYPLSELSDRLIDTINSLDYELKKAQK